jgi:RimJ/RimL family protein N-acetyltransferase
LPPKGDIRKASRNRRSTNDRRTAAANIGPWEIVLDAAEICIRRLTPEDAALYRSIRLAGLKESPEAFGSTFDAEFTKPLAWFFDRLSSSVVFGANGNAKILGVAGFAIRDGQKEAHKGLLWGMYVRPEARGAGIARRLVEAVIAFARARVELIQLSVVVGNEQARRLYARLGFVEYGIEKNSLKFRGRYFDEILMAKDLGCGSVLETCALPAGGSDREAMVSLITST